MVATHVKVGYGGAVQQQQIKAAARSEFGYLGTNRKASALEFTNRLGTPNLSTASFNLYHCVCI
jgi:hypothetical protein